ncbi:MAG: hypothetical protein RL213_1232 [Bacteroidota bacterium]|jgi:photosystem II stability/assembly factor-like uncharacterized protein
MHRLLKPLLLLLVPALSAFSTLTAQPWMRPSLVSVTGQPFPKNDIREISARFESHWKTRVPDTDEASNREEGGYQQFKRWEWFMKSRLLPSGYPVNPEIQWRESEQYRLRHAAAAERNISQWQFIGPGTLPANGGGAGRVNVFRLEPGNNSVIYVGAACGGIWKSVDGGLNWMPVSDRLAAISIADIAINPRNPDSVYAATGDGYGYEVSGGFWGGTYSAGVMLSPDGGATWQQCGLSFAQTNSEIIQRLVIKPDQPEVLLASTRNGLFRSGDAGATWSSVRSGHHFDIEFHPTRPDTVFATDETSLLWSVNGGVTWAVRQGGLCSGRLSLALTPANINRIFLVCENMDFFRSDDLGATIQQLSPPTPADFYGYYDAVLAVSPVNANTVICGGLNMAKSTDGGNTWTQIAPGVHPDQHYIDYQPGSGQVVYSCNDGGFYKSVNGGSSFTDLSEGLGIKQYYRFAQSASDPYTLFAGAQDNGTDRLTAGAWTRVFGGDGTDCMVDPANDQNVFASYQNGALQKSTDGGQNFVDISPSSGEWVTPFAMHPLNTQIIYGGYEEVYRSNDAGVSWNTLSSGVFNASLISMDVNRSDPDFIYTATYDRVYRTTDGGVNWSDITAGLPVANATVSSVTSSWSDPLTVWVTLSGYSSGQKVYRSGNGGATWSNMSGTLPNLPVNCLVEQFNASNPGSLYIGTDMGVFRTDSLLNDWQLFDSGLPNVVVSDLDIQYGFGKLRAATYGRGLWEADLNGFVPNTLDVSAVDILQPVGTVCYGPVSPLVVVANTATDTVTSMQIDCYVDNVLLTSLAWSGQLLPGQNDTVSLSQFPLYPGRRAMRIEVSAPNQAADQNPMNDRAFSDFIVLQPAVFLPVQEGFESQVLPPADWTVQDGAGLFALDAAVGGFSASTTSLYANCFDIYSCTSELVFPEMNFLWSTAPARLTFNVAYAVYSSAYHDSLAVSVSTDCGVTFQRIYAKGDDSLATVPPFAGRFQPSSPNDWRTETVDMDAYLGYSDVILRFEFISGYGNNIYLDDINISGSNTSVSEETVSSSVILFPDPADELLHVRIPSASAFSELSVADMFGRILMKKHVESASCDLDLTGLSSGYYRVLVAGNKELRSFPFVKR